MNLIQERSQEVQMINTYHYQIVVCTVSVYRLSK